jgi:hypothetical protein
MGSPFQHSLRDLTRAPADRFAGRPGINSLCGANLLPVEADDNEE